MFHNIPNPILKRMQELKARDALDSQDSTPHSARLRQIPPETGKLLALLCANAPKGRVLEVGTSAGYSSLWISLACKERGDKLMTFEIMDDKAALAKQTLEDAQIGDLVQLVHGDARRDIDDIKEVAFCFLDAEKDDYSEMYENVIPNLVPGGILAADNVISHAEHLSDFVTYAESDPRVDALVVPIGKGVLVCRKL